jgi:3-oxoadipate enol-lactonase
MNFAPFESWKIDRSMATQRSLLISANRAYDSLRATDLTHDLGRVKARTLVISGKQDGTVPVKQAHLLKERIANAQLVLYDECGHFPMFEKTDTYLETLKTFFVN